MIELESLPNIGKVSAAALKAAGINSGEELREIGAQEAFLRIHKYVDSTACSAFLLGLAGAEKGVPKRMLDVKTKEQCKVFYDKLKQA
ncbi:MAG: TfoX/Sxy family protein [Chloroflexi bacterium]|nr:TfoX/Sxy family protein [Chloroflexota bacterium]